MVNEGAFDRLFRLILGVVFLMFGWGMSNSFGPILVVLSAIMILTAAIGLFPIYAALGLNTLHDKEEATE
ncbi:MAG: DUF2892 domain-containing protein [Chloroflexota bacterium]